MPNAINVFGSRCDNPHAFGGAIFPKGGIVAPRFPHSSRAC